MVLNDATLVLNKHWVPVDVTTVLDALCKLYDGSARALHPNDWSLHDFDSWSRVAVAREQPCVRTATLAIPVPEIIVLARYGNVPARYVAFSRINIYRRDHYACQYCGRKPGAAELTIDHVLPRSRSGVSSWTNCVVACIQCNHRKGSRTPGEAGLTLRHKPARPEWTPRLVLARVPYRASWERFVSDAYWNVELEK